MTRLFYEVQRRPQARYVLASIGSGGGVGVAVLFEAVGARGSGDKYNFDILLFIQGNEGKNRVECRESGA